MDLHDLVARVLHLAIEVIFHQHYVVRHLIPQVAEIVRLYLLYKANGAIESIGVRLKLLVEASCVSVEALPGLFEQHLSLEEAKVRLVSCLDQLLHCCDDRLGYILPCLRSDREKLIVAELNLLVLVNFVSGAFDPAAKGTAKGNVRHTVDVDLAGPLALSEIPLAAIVDPYQTLIL